MKTYTNTSYHAASPCVVALGCFDGVHVGHAAVIRAAVEKARVLKLPCVVWTFAEPPRNYFSPGSALPLTDTAEKRRLIGALGADVLLCVPFGKEIAEMSPQVFFERILREQLRAAHVFCGFNFSFGKGGQGNAETLRTMCERSKIGFAAMSAVTVAGRTVSSSAIRSALQEGDPALARQLLGRAYSLRAPVIGGQRLARRLGFPTVNQEFPKGALIPRYGVYVTRVRIGKQIFYGISNVGIRPTVGTTPLCCETHLLNFEGDLYGRVIRVEFLHFLRSERSFDCVEALAAQVKQDIQKALLFFHEKEK